MASSPPKVALVVLNWNRWGDTRECLASLSRVVYRPREIYVVDNGSVDGSPARIRRVFPTMKLLALPRNRGYGGGMNVGIEAALGDGCDYVLCLNNDMTFDPGFVEPLVEAAEGGGTVPYPVIYDAEDPQRLDNAGFRVSPTGETSLVAHGAQAVPAEVRADYTELPFLSRDLLERVGRYKEDYFAFYEDVDLNLRFRSLGWVLRLVPESKVFHRRGRTTRRIPGLTSYYSIRNRLLLVRDNGTRGQWLLTVLHVLRTLSFQLVGGLKGPESDRQTKSLLLGLVDGLLPWRRGMTREWPPPS